MVYDLHSGNPEDVQLALDAMYKPRVDDDPAQEKIIILISSLLAWDNTPRNLEEIRSPQEIEEEMKAKPFFLHLDCQEEACRSHL